MSSAFSVPLIDTRQDPGHGGHGDRLAAIEKMTECVVDADFALLGGQSEDARILPGFSQAPAALQGVAGHSEPARRVEIVSVAVVLERARLLHEPFDDVPVVDLVFSLAAETRHHIDQTLCCTRIVLLGPTLTKSCLRNAA